MQSFTRLQAITYFLLFTSCARLAESGRIRQDDNADGTRDEKPNLLRRFANFYGHILGTEKRQSEICLNDTYYQVLENNSAAGPFCSTLIGAPTQTVETDYTPVVYVRTASRIT